MSDRDALDVYMHGDVAGTLERRSQARLRFTYAKGWVHEARAPLSLSLPVRPEPYEHDECAPFFEGLLPEGDFLKAIARTLHVSASNPFQLLTELGGECAGAISIAPAGGPEPGTDPRPPRWLSEGELSRLLADLPQRPLIAAIDEVEDGGFRLSLAGAQDKVAVLVEGDRIGLSHGRPPTTGILKAPIPHVEESVANEAFCMSLAAHADLDVAAAEPRLADSHEYLLVHRYDRSRETRDGRLHQEDFCQALGLVPAVKYEKEGGPAVADCADLIRRNCSAPARDITAFLDALLFNFAIANYDAHSKNYSLLLDGPGSIRLAPLYDLICTAAYPGTDRKLAMRYGGENRPLYLRGRHLDRLAGDLGVKPALVRRRADGMRERVEAAIEDARNSLPRWFQDHPIVDRVAATIAEWGEALEKRATENDEPTDPPSAQDVQREASTEAGRAAEFVVKGFFDLGQDLERVGTLIGQSGRDAEALPTQDLPDALVERWERLAEELEEPARDLRRHGREIYEAVIDLDAILTRSLSAIPGKGDLDSSRAELLRLLDGFGGEAVESGINSLEEVYAAISEMLQFSAVFRAPVRNVRAGLHDVLDARNIMVEWRGRASDLGPAGS